MTSIIVVIAVLSFLVMIHELGHYLAARKVGIRVREFGLGYPPRLRKLVKWGGTIFSLNWLPFGGFVRLAGDDAETIEQGGELDEDGKIIPKHELFTEKSVLQRLFVILAGVGINIVFGIAAFAILYMALGIPERLPHPIIEAVVEGSPAETVQMREGDVVFSLHSEEMKSSQEFIAKLQQFRGKTVVIEIERDGQRFAVEPYIRTVEETPANQGGLGIALGDTEIKHYPWWIMIPKGVERGIQDSIMFAQEILRSLGNLVVTVAQKRSVPQELAGPIGIVVVAEKEKVFDQGAFAILNFAGLLSINLGVLNLLPIPALDGGRAVFILLEKVLGKQRRAKYERHANAVGMVLLLGLIVMITVKDVIGIFRQ